MAIKKIYFAEKSDVTSLATKATNLCSTMRNVKLKTDRISTSGRYIEIHSNDDTHIRTNGAIHVDTCEVFLDSVQCGGINGPDRDIKNRPHIRMTARGSGIERELSMSCGCGRAYLHLVNVDTMTNCRLAAHIPIEAFENLQGAIVCIVGGSCGCGCGGSCGCGCGCGCGCVPEFNCFVHCGFSAAFKCLCSLSCGEIYKAIGNGMPICYGGYRDCVTIIAQYQFAPPAVVHAQHDGGDCDLGQTSVIFIGDDGNMYLGAIVHSDHCLFAIQVFG